jgi:hypothetical protein
MNTLDNLQDGINHNEPISSLIQEVLNDVMFKAHGATQFYFRDDFRATMLTKAMAMIRDYAKQNGN